jgi:glycosyltransferase involved in cell wall biosynthesis
MACAGEHFGVPKGWVAALGLALSEPVLKKKMTALHSVSTYVDEVTRANLHLSTSDRVSSIVIPSFQDEDLDRQEATADLSPWLDRLPSEPFVLFVGAFRRLKGLETLFDAYARLDPQPPLVLMGTFERDSPQALPEGVTVLDDVPHAAVMAAWDRALFGVMPSLWSEPLGATVAEAMSRGKAVIGTRPGGHSDMIDEHNGILVPRGDAAALAAAMTELIVDPGRREALGAAARERARSFAADRVLPRFERVYEEARPSSRGPRSAPRSGA